MNVAAAAAADTNDCQFNEQHIRLTKINPKSPAIRKTYEDKLFIHYTHEKRFESLKRDMHKIYHDIFQNSPVDDLKLIVGTRNRRDARNDLIRTRPSRELL